MDGPYRKIIFFHGNIFDLGKSFAEFARRDPNTLTVLSTRPKDTGFYEELFGTDGRAPADPAYPNTMRIASGTDPAVCKAMYEKQLSRLVNNGKPVEVLLVYGIGPMTIEVDQNGQYTRAPKYSDIDPNTRRAVVYGFKHLANSLYRLARDHSERTGIEINLKLITLGSVRDKLDLEQDGKLCLSLWLAKQAVRRRLARVFSGETDRDTLVKVSAMMVSTISIDTYAGRALRPTADRTYWLSTDDVAEHTLEQADLLKPGEYKDSHLYTDRERAYAPCTLTQALEAWAKLNGVPVDSTTARDKPRER